MNTPSADGLKGWNAGEITQRKAGSGFITKINESEVSLDKAKIDEIFALEDALRQKIADASLYTQSEYMKAMQSFIDGSQTVDNSNGDGLMEGSVSASIDDSTIKDTNGSELEEEWVKVKPLALAIEDEKIGLGTLPRIQPERVLSNEDLINWARKR